MSKATRKQAAARILPLGCGPVGYCWTCAIYIRSWDGEEIDTEPKPLNTIKLAECHAAGHDVRPAEVR